MEIKKTESADLEHGRLRWFLMAFILVMSVFYVALEWQTDDSDDGIDEAMLDDIVRDMEINAAIPMQQTVTMPVKKQTQTEERLKVVDNDTELRDNEPEKPIDDVAEADVPTADQAQGLTPEEAANATTAIAPPGSNPLNFRVVADLPQYPGGAVEFVKWLTENLKYPPLAQRKKIQGKVVAQFIVNADGSISDLKIVKSLEPTCDREALRVLRMMPNWKPGLEDGKPCRTMVAIPIVFKL